MLGCFQEKLIFFPQKLPLDFKFQFQDRFDELFIETEPGVKINALHFQVSEPKGVVLYFHGNAGSLATWGNVAKDFLPLNYDVFIIDYRGYGKSSSEISSEELIHRDAEVLYQRVVDQYSEKNIIVYGRSIGTGVAAKLAADHSPRLLILETPYFNFLDLVKHYYSFLPRFIVRYKLLNNEYVKRAEVPIFLIHGTKDKVVPYSSSEKLAKVKPGIQLFTIKDGGHNNLSDFDEFHEALKRVLQ